MRSASRFSPANLAVILCLALCLSAALSTRSSAQGFRWPEEPENLQVLPKDVKGARLGQVMRGFASALGVRCEHCHVGEGPDLTKFDFPSDEKITKRKARVMIQMVQAINRDHLSKLTALENPPQERIEVACMTCHHTQTTPRLLEDLLSETIQKDGVEAAVTQYRELREKYYGGFAYDFSSGVLTGLGESLAAGGNTEAALRMLQLEIEVNGESASVYFTLGRVQAGAGMREEAIQSFERGMELAPENWKPFYQKQIDRLRNP